MARVERITSRPLRESAERLLSSMMADQVVVDAVAAAEIQRQIAIGELIPTDRLLMGPGFELAPLGRIAELETAILLAMDKIEDQNYAGARDVLSKTMPVHEEPVDAETDLEDEDEPETSEPSAPTVEAPVEAPASGKTRPCLTCGIDVPFEDAMMSYTRFRKVFCRPHFIAHNEEPAALGPASGEDDDAPEPV